MKKLTPFKTLAAFALAASLIFISCQPPTDETPTNHFNAKTPAEAFEHLKIPAEMISTNTTRMGNRSVTSRGAGLPITNQNNPYNFEPIFVNLDSRGCIFLYMLKYDLSRLPEFKDLNFNATITWETSHFSDTTKEFIKKSQGSITGQVVIDNMSGKIHVYKENDIIYCIQKNNNGKFTHYITLTPNKYDSYDIAFFAFEQSFGGRPGTQIGYELTSITGPNSFTYTRHFFETTEETITLDSLKENGIQSYNRKSKAQYENGIYKYYDIADNGGSTTWFDMTNNAAINILGNNPELSNPGIGVIDNDPTSANKIFYIKNNDNWINVMALEKTDSNITLEKETETFTENCLINPCTESTWKWKEGATSVDLCTVIEQGAMAKFANLYNMNTECSICYYVKESGFNGKLKIKDEYSNLFEKVTSMKTGLATVVAESQNPPAPTEDTRIPYGKLADFDYSAH